MKKVIAIVVIIVLTVSLWGCDPYVNKYPANRSDSWYCKELDFTLNVDQRTSELKWAGEIYTVEIAMHVDYYLILLENGQNIKGEKDVLFRGTWSYSGKRLVLKISEDNLFNGAYKKLVFEPISSD